MIQQAFEVSVGSDEMTVVGNVVVVVVEEVVGDMPSLCTVETQQGDETFYLHVEWSY